MMPTPGGMPTPGMATSNGPPAFASQQPTPASLGGASGPGSGVGVSAFRAVGSQLAVASPAVKPATSPLPWYFHLKQGQHINPSKVSSGVFSQGNPSKVTKWYFQPGKSRDGEKRGKQWKRKHLTCALINSKVTRMERSYSRKPHQKSPF